PVVAVVTTVVAIVVIAVVAAVVVGRRGPRDRAADNVVAARLNGRRSGRRLNGGCLDRRLHARRLLSGTSLFRAPRLLGCARLFAAARRFPLRLRLALSVLLSSRRLAALGVPFLCKCWRRRQNGEQRRG